MTEHNENTIKPLETDLPVDDVLAGLPKDLLEPYEDGNPAAQDTSDEVDTPLLYRDYSQDYSQKTVERAAEKRQHQREDRWLVTLMAIASVLCAGIIAVLIFWLNTYLK